MQIFDLIKGKLGYFSHPSIGKIFQILALILFSIISFYFDSKDINLKIAYKGWGPQDYVSRKLNPENYKKNFDNGILAYDNSLIMRSYYTAKKYFNIEPSTFVYPFMLIQTLLFVFSVAFLTQTLFNNKIVTLISVFIILLSNLPGLDLARFGFGYKSFLKYPLYYGYAISFGIFALAYFLRNDYIKTFVFLILSIYCHVTMGFFIFGFISFYVVFNPRILREIPFIKGIAVFIIFIIPFFIYIIINNQVTGLSIPHGKWILLTKIFSLHWYPFTMKLFTQRAHNEFFPIILASIFFILSLRYQNLQSEINKKIIFGLFASFLMTIAGLIFSQFIPIPFFIKIAFHRSSGLISFIGVLYIIYYLFKKIDGGNLLIIFISFYTYSILIFSQPGIAILPLLLLVFFDIREGYFGPLKINFEKEKIYLAIYFTMVFLILILGLLNFLRTTFSIKIVNIFSDFLWPPLRLLNPFANWDFLLQGGLVKISGLSIEKILFIILFLTAIIKINDKISYKLNSPPNYLLIGIPFVAFLLSVLIYCHRDSYHKWKERYAKKSQAYLDVQLWAKRNTPKDSLFMTDPTHYYGWRDFSKRSSFGNLREWGYTSIGYNSNLKSYNEGKKRMNDFGIDIDRITERDLPKSKNFIYGIDLTRKLNNHFYSMSSDKIKSIARKYKIDYIIMKRKFLKEKLNFKIVYKNKYFLVYIVHKLASKLNIIN